MNKLLEAAKAVLESMEAYRRELHNYVGQGGSQQCDAEKALRKAVQDAEAYTPLTNAEHYQIWSAGGAYMPIDDWNLTVTWEDERVVERAVVERLGLRWPE